MTMPPQPQVKYNRRRRKRIFLCLTRIDLLYLDYLPSTTSYVEWTSTTETMMATPTLSDIVSSIVPTTTSVPMVSSSTTSMIQPTATPSTSDNSNSGGGLSDKNKAIVGGVVGGVGGAALIGFIAFMIVSRWKRSRREHDMEVFRPRSDDYTASVLSVHPPEMTEQQQLNQRY